MMIQKFFKCSVCGNMVGMIRESGVPMECCGQPMTEMKANTFDGATEKHVPVVEISGARVLVKVGEVDHPMLPEHYIQWIYLKTEQGGQRKELKPGDSPQATFELTDGDKPLTAYEYCNLHGLWAKEIERSGENMMKKYECSICGYIYDEAAGDPDHGVVPGTRFEDIPDDWTCPMCGMGKDLFNEVA